MTNDEVLDLLRDDERVWFPLRVNRNAPHGNCDHRQREWLIRLAGSRSEARGFQRAAADLRHALEQYDQACEAGACLLCFPPDGQRHAPDCTVPQALALDAGQRATWSAESWEVRCAQLEQEAREAAAREREEIAATIDDMVGAFDRQGDEAMASAVPHVKAEARIDYAKASMLRALAARIRDRGGAA